MTEETAKKTPKRTTRPAARKQPERRARPAMAAPAAAPRKGRTAPKPKPREALLGELRTLQTVLAEVLARVNERLGTRLLGLVAAVEGPGGATLGARRISAMSKAVKAVNVKAAKGRVKDLIRLRDLLDELQELLATEA